MVSCVNPLILNPSVSDPFRTIPPNSTGQPTIPTPPTPPVSNHLENHDLDLAESKLCFQQEFTLLSMKYNTPWNPCHNCYQNQFQAPHQNNP